MARPVRLASCCSSHFHRRRRAPLLPPASAVISSDWACAIGRAAHLLPPASNRLHGEGRGVVIDADAHPAFVAVQIVDAVRNGLAARRRLDQEVVDAHPLGRLRRAPRAAGVLEVPDQFLLLRVHRDRRLLLPLRRAHAPRDVAKLRVPIDVLAAFARLDVALQAVAEAVQQLGDHRVADVVAQPLERHRQACARSGTSSAAASRDRRAPSARPTRPSRAAASRRDRSRACGRRPALRVRVPGERLARRELTQAPLNRRRRDPRRARHLRDAAVADRLGFRGRPHPARSLRQHGRQGRMLRPQGGQIHERTVPLADQKYKVLFPDRP